MSDRARPPATASWIEVEPWSIRAGHLNAAWQDLGRAAGSRRIGVRRIRIEPRAFSTPVHAHGAEEEIFYVLGGEGLLWQGGRAFALGADDCIVHLPRGEPHTLRGGEVALEVLAFGQRAEAGLAHLPRAGVSWAHPSWVEAGHGEPPWEREVAAGPPDCPRPEPHRPPNVLALADAPRAGGGASRQLGAGAGSVATGLNHVSLAGGGEGPPAHCHSAEEELFAIVAGSGQLELYAYGPEGPDVYPVRTGDVISRRAGSGVAHALRPGSDGLTYLAYGTREAHDMTLYPHSGRIALRGLGVAFTPASPQYRPRPAS